LTVSSRRSRPNHAGGDGEFMALTPYRPTPAPRHCMRLALWALLFLPLWDPSPVHSVPTGYTHREQLSGYLYSTSRVGLGKIVLKLKVSTPDESGSYYAGTMRCRTPRSEGVSGCPGSRGRIDTFAVRHLALPQSPPPFGAFIAEFTVTFDNGNSCAFTGTVPFRDPHITAISGSFVCTESMGLREGVFTFSPNFFFFWDRSHCVLPTHHCNGE
jgi:hypothetical protein